MLKQVIQGSVCLLKALTPISAQTECILSSALSTSTLFAARSDNSGYKVGVRQGLTQEEDPIKNHERPVVPYDKFKNSPFPTAETFSQVFNGIPFNQLPIIHIKATYNNTIITATHSDGKPFALKSAGTVGFRNARRGTNVAAQAAAIALAGDLLRQDVKIARACLRGIGPGRLPALKAIQLTGVDIISITDTTPLPHNGNRPKKARRL